MANGRLRAALLEGGLEIEDLAAKVQVDAKTVQRWLGGRTPHARYRAKVAQVLDLTEVELWPETAPATRRDDRRDLAGVYAQAGDIRVPGWRTLMQDARQQIDLLDYTLKDILASPGATDLLAAKAETGCQVRILIAHPKSIWVTSLAQQLGQDTPDAEGNTELDRDIDLARGHPPTPPRSPRDRGAELLGRALQHHPALRRRDARHPAPLGHPRTRSAPDPPPTPRRTRSV